MPFLEIAVHRASPDDLVALERLYGLMAVEQAALHAMWPRADGLGAPLPAALAALVDDAGTAVYVGTIDGVPVGFLTTRVRLLLEDGDRVGVIDYVFTEVDARGVGVGEAMLERALADLRAAGLRRFDAFALPGHRSAKNFFESGGFSARRLVMHHDDDRE